MLESQFQAQVIKELKQRFDGCIVMKLDSAYKQGIPDLLFLHDGFWATLECKKTSVSAHRPNQKYWVNKMNEMSFSKFIYPENKEVIFDEIQHAYEAQRDARVFKR